MLIKEITKDGYTLTHEWFIDDFGLKRNSFDIFHIKSSTHYPFLSNFRVDDYDFIIEGDNISPYTDKEYEEMLEEQINKLKKYDKSNKKVYPRY